VLGLRHREWRAAHRLDTPGNEEIAVPSRNGMARGNDCGQPGRAEPIHGHARNVLGQASKQDGHARDVAVVLAGLIRAAEVDVFDLAGIDTGAADRLPDDARSEIVGSHIGECAAVAPDRRAHTGEDDGTTHCTKSSRGGWS
jgi:hypothetical protein